MILEKYRSDYMCNKGEDYMSDFEKDILHSEEERDTQENCTYIQFITFEQESDKEYEQINNGIKDLMSDLLRASHDKFIKDQVNGARYNDRKHEEIFPRKLQEQGGCSFYPSAQRASALL